MTYNDISIFQFVNINIIINIMDNKSMDKKFMEAINQYYKLKEQYDNDIEKEKKRILTNDKLSKKDKRERFKQIKKKCINCKKVGGTIFTNDKNILKAVCGSVEPCNLKIELLKSVYLDAREEMRLYSKDLDIIKRDIIMTKLDFLFGYTGEEETLSIFYSQNAEISNITERLYYVNNIINNIANNKEDQILMKKYEKMYYNNINILNNIYKDYKTDNKPEYIKNMVELYIEKIKPLAENIRKLKYLYTGIDDNEEDDTYKLIEKPYTINQMEFITGQKNTIISFVQK
jgi:hypothetical protein